MAYQVPKQWSHGDRVNATDMQKYSDGQEAINTSLASFGYNFATPYSQYPDAQEYWLVHRKQFLIYVSTGEIRDPSGNNEPINLSNADETYNSYDLDSIPWMLYGMLYKVVGCTVCMEDDTEA